MSGRIRGSLGFLCPPIFFPQLASPPPPPSSPILSLGLVPADWSSPACHRCHQPLACSSIPPCLLVHRPSVFPHFVPLHSPFLLSNLSVPHPQTLRSFHHISLFLILKLSVPSTTSLCSSSAHSSFLPPHLSVPHPHTLRSFYNISLFSLSFLSGCPYSSMHSVYCTENILYTAHTLCLFCISSANGELATIYLSDVMREKTERTGQRGVGGRGGRGDGRGGVGGGGRGRERGEGGNTWKEQQPV